MDAELRLLRSVIRAAERGENKRVKNTARFLARKGRELERVAREQEKLQEQELTRLEKFLGETFETLSEARRAEKKDTRKATKKEILSESQRLREKARRTTSEKQRVKLERQARRFERESGKHPLLPSVNSYSIRDLSAFEKQSIIDFLNDKKTFNQVGIGYLQQNETLALSIPYRYRGLDGAMHKAYAQGYKIIDSWPKLYSYIMGYLDEDKNDYEDVENWLGEIKIIKFQNRHDQIMERARQSDKIHSLENKERKKAVKKMYAREREEAIKKATEKATEKQRRTEARLARSERENRQLQAELRQAQERIR